MGFGVVLGMGVYWGWVCTVDGCVLGRVCTGDGCALDAGVGTDVSWEGCVQGSGVYWGRVHTGGLCVLGAGGVLLVVVLRCGRCCGRAG